MDKKTFINLISLAQQDSGPSINVADDVISSISTMTCKPADSYRAYTWIGTASAAVAACILVAATLFWQSNTDSVSEIITYVSWVAQ